MLEQGRCRGRTKLENPARDTEPIEESHEKVGGNRMDRREGPAMTESRNTAPVNDVGMTRRDKLPNAAFHAGFMAV
jgi:hypothetical protein